MQDESSMVEEFGCLTSPCPVISEEIIVIVPTLNFDGM